MLDAIDDRTAVVAFSHVLFRTSFIMDAAAIVAARPRVGAAVMLDTYQSAGIIPVDVTALGVDFSVGGCLKWLCGGPGNAFLYTRPDLLQTRGPRSPDGCRAAHPFAFDIDDADAARRRDADDERHAVHPGLLRGAGRTRHHREVGVDRIRAAVAGG